MSLDVSLEIPGEVVERTQVIYVRENGQTIGLTREQWNDRHPDREPIVLDSDETDSVVYSANITHNLNKMADAAGVYMYIWRPDELGIVKAEELIEPLQNGLTELKSSTHKYKSYNPPNGWGRYEDLVDWIDRYLDACKKYPEAKVRVSR